MRKLLLILGLVYLLGGCGGGGTDPIEIPNTSINHLLGKWFADDLTCRRLNDNSSIWTGSYYQNGPIDVKTGTYTETSGIYSDPTCSNLTGQYTDKYKVIWSKPIALQPKINAIRSLIFEPIREPTGTAPEKPLLKTEKFWVLFDGDGKTLSIYYGDNGDTVDAEGYPQGTNNFPSATYHK